MTPSATADEPPSLREVLKDEHASGADFWIYNDLEKAFEVARRENKPLFVTFRCVPCKACAGFDAEVARGAEAIRDLARQEFVAVRQVEMKGVDLSQFQFDYDLNWAAMFLNADGTVYARYGTQSAAGPDAYNSVTGLINTMRRVLKLHAGYPANRAALEGKRGAKKPYRTALEMPGLENPDRFRAATTRRNCIHCHNIHDAENLHAARTGKLTKDFLWRYPLPENIGLVIDAESGIRIREVVADSPAARAGLEAGEDVTHMNGQAITSIADMQWVLHHLPNRDTELVVRGSRSGQRTVRLPAGWKEYDISWRGSMWSISPRLRMWTPELDVEKRRRAGIDADRLALEIRWINANSTAGRAARKAGLRQGDVIVAIDGKATRMTPQQFHTYVKLNHAVGERVELTLLRNGRRVTVQLPLVE